MMMIMMMMVVVVVVVVVSLGSLQAKQYRLWHVIKGQVRTTFVYSIRRRN